LTWCDKIVWIYPCWWSSVPAGVKGWIDRVFVAGVAYETPKGAGDTIKPLLNVKKTALISTWGGSSLIPWYTGDLGKMLLCRVIPISCYKESFPESLVMKLHKVYDSQERREAFLARVEEQMSLF
jgi:putative NADPH-quinone reductase